MKILSSFTHPQVVSNLHEFILLLNTKEDVWSTSTVWLVFSKCESIMTEFSFLSEQVL